MVKEQRKERIRGRSGKNILCLKATYIGLIHNMKHESSHWLTAGTQFILFHLAAWGEFDKTVPNGVGCDSICSGPRWEDVC